MSYFKTGQPSIADIDFDAWSEEAQKRKKEVLEIFNDSNKFEQEFKQFCKKRIYEQKRAWCSLRDFFKSPEFSNHFFHSLAANGFEGIDQLRDPEMLAQLELPGDVWNNNPIFRKCVLKGTVYEGQTAMPLNVLLRRIYREEQIDSGCPEQFDITFDFVPRMCTSIEL